MGDQKNDIEKYLNGELSKEEMHRLEMRSLNDPFLADAIEGADLITPKQFVEDVNALNQEIKNTKTKRFYWPLRIAASILLIISLTYLIFQVSPEDSTEPLALKKENKTEEAINNKKIDSIEDSEAKAESKEKSNLTFEEKPVVKPKAVPNNVIEDRETQQPSPEISEETLTSIQKTELEVTEMEKVNEADAAIAQDLKILENKEVTQLKTETRRMRSDALKKSASPSPRSGADSKENESSQAATITAKPTIGMKEYENYLEKNIQYPKEALDKKISGEVIVSFLVSADGSLSDFKIEKSIGFGCDEELVKVIKSGPDWVPTLLAGAPMAGRASVSFFFDSKK